MTQSIAVGIIGYSGSARTFHLPLILSLPGTFHLHSIQQRASSSAPDCRNAHPDVQRVETVEELLAALPNPALVVVTTTNETHVPFARQALKAGKHVVVEKPMAVTLEEAKELEALAKETGLVCAAYQNRRWDGDFLTLRSLLTSRAEGEAPALGVPTHYESRFDRFRPKIKGGWREETKPEQGGGVLWDLGAHLVDQTLSLFGPPENLTAFVRNARGQQSPDVDDEFTLHLNYPSASPLPPSAGPLAGVRLGGLTAVLGASCLSAHVDAEQPRFRVLGTTGSYVKRGVDPQEAQLKAGWTPASHDGSFGVYEAHEPAELRLGRLTTTAPIADATTQPQLVAADIPTLPGTYIEYYANVAAAINASQGAQSKDASYEAVQRTLAVRPAQVVDAVKTILLARKSATEGRTVKWDEL